MDGLSRCSLSCFQEEDSLTCGVSFIRVFFVYRRDGFQEVRGEVSVKGVR